MRVYKINAFNEGETYFPKKKEILTKKKKKNNATY